VGEPERRPTPILIVSNHGDVVGGGELSLIDLLRGLDRHRWAPVLVVPEDGGVAASGRDLGLAVHVLPLPTLRLPGADVLRSVTALGRLARATNAALIHANGSRAMIYGGLAGRSTRRPAIWHVRIAESDGVTDRALYALATGVIATSQAVARRFRPGARKIRLIPNGVDLARFTPRPPSPELRAALGVPPSAPVVLSIGRLTAEKGHRHLLEAAAWLERTKPGLHWVIVGDGELEHDLRARARHLGLAAQVHIAGWRDDIPDVLALCDVFVLPSDSEGFGRVLIEAMAMGKVVVATAVGGVPEVVRADQTGILVAPAAPGQLAAAVRSLLDDPARAARLGAQGRVRAESTFGLAAHVDAVERVYAELLRAGREGADVGSRDGDAS
jgi:glycosyltransferase involved in cell wall biosynthesis